MNEVARYEGGPVAVAEERSVEDVQLQVVKIQELMKSVMKLDEHYGVIPGTGSKPSLLKPGAEKLCFVFRLAPEFEITERELPGGHREDRVVCRLRSMGTGNIVGEGVGSCSTMESKYRYRNASDYEILDTPIPKDARERKAEYRKQGFGMKQIEGQWCWVRYTSTGKVENPDIADTYNTVLKMAKKRAHVDATITACAASDIFTQDIEDFPENEKHESPEPRRVKAEPVERPPVNMERVEEIRDAYQGFIDSGVLNPKGAEKLQELLDSGETDLVILEKYLAEAKKGYERATKGAKA